MTSNQSNGLWTDERTERVRVLRAEGYSATSIARHLTAEFGETFTRNAVLGKIHRKGWSKPATSQPRGPQARTYKRKVSVGETPPPLALEKETPPLPDVDGFLPVGEIAGAGQCHWIEGDPKWSEGGDGRYCGAPTGSVAKPYCAAHRARMWDKNKTAKSTAKARAKGLARKRKEMGRVS